MTIVKLSVHKNNKLQREKKNFRKDAIQSMARRMKFDDVAGYALVVWYKNGRRNTSWNITSESPIKLHEMPVYSKHCLESDLIDWEHKE